MTSVILESRAFPFSSDAADVVDSVGDGDRLPPLPPLGGDKVPRLSSYDVGRGNPGGGSLDDRLMRPKNPFFFLLPSSNKDAGAEFQVGRSSALKGIHKRA